MSTHATHHRHESVVGEYIAALANEALYELLRLLHWLNRLIVGPKFVAPPTAPREPFGADDQTADDLHAIGVQLAEDKEFGLFGGDLPPLTPVWPRDPDATGVFTDADFADAMTNLAFAGGNR